MKQTNNLDVRHKYGIRDKNRVRKWKRQRIRRGFADIDLWNLDHHLLELLPAMLERLGQSTHSYPMDMESGEQWTEWLNETANMFRVINKKMNEERYDKDFDDEINKLLDEAFARLRERFFDLWD